MRAGTLPLAREIDVPAELGRKRWVEVVGDRGSGLVDEMMIEAVKCFVLTHDGEWLRADVDGLAASARAFVGAGTRGERALRARAARARGCRRALTEGGVVERAWLCRTEWVCGRRAAPAPRRTAAASAASWAIRSRCACGRRGAARARGRLRPRALTTGWGAAAKGASSPLGTLKASPATTHAPRCLSWQRSRLALLPRQTANSGMGVPAAKTTMRTTVALAGLPTERRGRAVRSPAVSAFGPERHTNGVLSDAALRHCARACLDGEGLALALR